MMYLVWASKIPAGDKETKTSDAYCKVFFTKKQKKETKVIKSTLNPIWKEFLYTDINGFKKVIYCVIY